MKNVSRVLFACSLVAITLVLVPTVGSSTTPANSVAWTQVDDLPLGCTSTCTGAPPIDAGTQMAYDAATHQMILFGAGGNSTWEWSGSAWSQIDDGTDPACTNLCTSSPPYRNVFGMTYDAASGAIIVFGGDSGNDTWAWKGTTWTQVADGTDGGCTTSCPASPPDSIGSQMAYDAATKQVVLFGGGSANYAYDYNDTWVLTYHGGSSYSWSQADAHTDSGCTLECLNSPPGRNVSVMAYDTATQQLVLFGGELTAARANGQNDTWLWTGTTWHQVDDRNGAVAGCGESDPTLDPCPTSPEARIGAEIAFDPALGDLVLFGGMNHYNNPEYDDTWAWNGATWTHIDNGTDPSCSSSCAGSPPANDTFAFGDDAHTNQLVLFGGYGLNATWVARATPSVPSAPTHLLTSTHGTVVTMSWAAPLNLGASPISHYKIVASPGHETCIVAGKTACSLSGFVATKRYTFAITASNSVGTGPAATLKNVKG